MKASRIAALGLVAGAGIWIASGHFMPHESAQSRAAMRAGESDAKKPFRVAVATIHVFPHGRKLLLSGRTEAFRRVVVTARTGGVLTDLRVRRGSWVDEGDVMAVLSDEAREAQVAQARAVVTQKRTELEAKRQLILNGTLPKLQLVDLGAQAGDLCLDHPAEHVEGELVADAHAIGLGHLVLDRDQRRTGVVLRPPRPGHDPAPLRRARGVAERAIAPERPVLDPALPDRHALDPDHPAADHRRIQDQARDVVGCARLGRQRIVKLRLHGTRATVVLQERWVPSDHGWRIAAVEVTGS